MSLHSRVVLLVLACLYGAPNARAQSITKVGSEFQVNTYTPDSQPRFSVDLDGDGDFVVVWDSRTQDDGESYGVFARRFNAEGVPQDSEFQVNSFTPGSQSNPDVAVGNDGSFVVVWQGVINASVQNIFARRFNSSGQAQGIEIEVNSYTSGSERRPRVAIDAAGGFVAAWEDTARDGADFGIFARRFDSAGAPQGIDFQVNSFTNFAQNLPDVAMHGAGAFAVVWHSFDQDDDSLGVFGQAFDSAGVRQASEFQVNAYTRFSQRYPSVAADTTGGFVVAWQSDQYFSSYPDIFARRFNAEGSPNGPEFRVNVSFAFTGSGSLQGSPAVAAEPDGDFVIAWNSGSQDGDSVGVFARRFNASGTAQTPEMQVNSYTVGFQANAAVGVDGNGAIVIVWTSPQDGSFSSGFGQRFDTLAVLDVDGNGSVGPLTDGVLSLRYQFGFRGAVLVADAVDLAGCRRCNAPAIESYLQAQN